MSTSPPDLHDQSAMGLSPFRVYNTVSFGVRSTAMPSSRLSDQDRAVAFYTMAVRQPACSPRGARVTLAERALADDNQLVARFGEPALPCLRR
jgi:hypothetical protein